MDYIQKSFVGGVDLINADTNIAEDAYIWLINARQRLGFIEPNKKNIQVDDIPNGTKQASISIGDILIVFVAGYAYYRVEDSGNPWIQIPNFHMSETVNRYYLCAVPASTFNFQRKLVASIHAAMLVPNFKVSGTPAGIVVQDTENQPWLIEFDATNQVFTSRVTKNFAQWSNSSITANDREYVPIGKQMMYKDGILHIVSRDGKNVYRSVTGRPLDFMMNVDTNGHKAATELLGGALTTSYNVDFDEITCLTEIDIPDSFIYATKYNVRIVTADYSRTIFGEPLFRVAATVRGAGIVNQFSFVEGLNDYTFISDDGVKSFNAVQALKFKGNSAVFSKQLETLLYNPSTKKRIKQRFCNCIAWQNFLLFNIDTLWGNLIAVYDNLLEKWVSLDITGASRIKQFTVVETALRNKLYCITEYDEMFELYGEATETEVAELRVRGFTSQQTKVEHKSAFLRPFFNGGSFDGKVYITEYVDDQLSVDPLVVAGDDYRHSHDLVASLGGVPYPVIPPVMPNNVQRVDLPGFALTRGLSGKKLSFVLQWTNDAALVEVQLTTSEQAGQTSQKQKDLILQS